jgi:hypothetical protein
MTYKPKARNSLFTNNNLGHNKLGLFIVQVGILLFKVIHIQSTLITVYYVLDFMLYMGHSKKKCSRVLVAHA